MTGAGDQTPRAFGRVRRTAAAVLLLTAALATAGCTRPEGDFGRARPSYLHDDLMPVVGARSAAMRGEPVSPFNRTDTERLLGDQSWSLVRPPHAGQWWMAVAAELQRTRLTAATDLRFDPGGYYAHLRAGDYRSSEARWGKAAADALADAELLPPFCHVVRLVRRDDAERLAVLGRRGGMDDDEYASAEARVAENEALIAWAGRAVGYRIVAYREAIDRLEVETPSRQLFETNRALDTLVAASGCLALGGAIGKWPLPEAPTRPGRPLGDLDGPVLQK
ncbi:hypothetical protein [Methylobrevis albus]|uniref:Uncharacterized protein n=1 Tax=Methylobrevis albus TaxID=2793297 RepID=A0A931I1D2_9HYPH|nr:hypothetical protein [Methylobrevis albus]MBH0237171.1 hypothetical protein [Methylobrevis albus]